VKVYSFLFVPLFKYCLVSFTETKKLSIKNLVLALIIVQFIKSVYLIKN